MSMTLSERNLFGGALVCNMPENALDASEARQIPDNQEVFTNKTCDQSIIFDILEMPTETSELAKHAATFHFEVIVSDDDNKSEQIEDRIESADSNLVVPETFESCATEVTAARGKQLNEHRDGTATDVQLTVVVFRMIGHRTDMVVTFNNSEFDSADENSARWTDEDFCNVARSLKLLDQSLFINDD
ncbi:ran guanine nucleotide release factor-like [Convolutriloba macropyga]|uniref:ran guanine nucleotide release factor-like n=1 Tax=Convolutriloba macropyga TaxID=536237 RepID=UPI003F51B1D8